MSKSNEYMPLGQAGILRPFNPSSFRLRIPFPEGNEEHWEYEESCIHEFLMCPGPIFPGDFIGDHWIELRSDMNPTKGYRHDDAEYREVNPCYVVQVLKRVGLKVLPRELEPYQRIVEQLPEKWWYPDEPIEHIPTDPDLTMKSREDHHAASDLTDKAVSKRHAAAVIDRMDEMMVGEVTTALAVVTDKADRSLRLTRARREILETLNSSKIRLSQTKLLTAMKQAGMGPSEHTVRIELANMMKAGWIDNDQESKPRGYGATDLGRTRLETS